MKRTNEWSKRPIIETFNNGYIPEPNSGCWLWHGAFTSRGTNTSIRGVISRGKKSIYAHRVSYELFVGPIPEGLYVCHKCDVPLCVNPRHLYAGTAKDNALDAMRRNRLSRHRVCGERNGVSKLTNEKVKAIRSDSRSQAVIARDYGVHQSLISLVKSGKSWGHV